MRRSVDANGRGVILAEESGNFVGKILGPNKLRVRFVRTDDQFTAFEAVLRRSS